MVMLLSACVVALLFGCCLGVDPPPSAPKYVIDLDEPPEERWAQVSRDYSWYFPQMMGELETLVPKDVIIAVSDLAAHLDEYFPYPYGDELRGFVKYSGNNVTLGELVLGNILYEITAFYKPFIHKGFCTSIVASDAKGTIYHGRNLDYHMFPILKKMTIVVQFKKGTNDNVFTGTTFAGLIGMLTGCKPNAFSISLNERDKGNPIANLYWALKVKGHGIVSLLIRDVLEKDGLDYKGVVATLSNTPLITPSYLIVAGIQPSEGVVITRDRSSAINIMSLNPGNGTWYVLETNYDNWKDPPKSDDRRHPAINAMNAIGQSLINATSLFQVLSTHPVLNDGTTYTTIMSPANPDIYRTVVRL
jgi:N-acylethanolamine-hydrolysing acid amidase